MKPESPTGRLWAVVLAGGDQEPPEGRSLAPLVRRVRPPREAGDEPVQRPGGTAVKPPLDPGSGRETAFDIR